MSYNPLNLSPRQIEVAKLVSQDISSEDIAKKLGISERTVEMHRYEIRTRLKARTSIGIANYTNNHLVGEDNG